MRFETLKEYKEWLASIPDEEKEPFCPFMCAYCNVAYSEECFKCKRRVSEELENE